MLSGICDGLWKRARSFVVNTEVSKERIEGGEIYVCYGDSS
jgi:hypothetical protein